MAKEKKQASDKKVNSEMYNFIMSKSFEEDIGNFTLTKLKNYETVLKNRDNVMRTVTKLFLLIVPLIFIGLIFFATYISYIDYAARTFLENPGFKKLLLSADNGFVICLGVFIEILFFIFRIYFLEKYDNKKQLITRQIRIIQRQNSKPEEKREKDFFDRIIDINNDNLSDYYQQVRKNVNNLLYVGIFVGIAGFLFIFISLIIGGITGKNINLVYLSTVTGIIIDSFAGTFFIQYGKSIKNMQFYFEGLLKTQDKILDLKAKSDIIDNSIKEM